MSLYDFACWAEGFRQFNSTGDDDAAPLSAGEVEQLAPFLDAPPIWH